MPNRALRIQNQVFNRAARALLVWGAAPPTYALLETTGRRSGLARQVPVANGLQGNRFWLIVGLGDRAQYLKNIEANPRVRVKARPARVRDGWQMRWYSGTAELVPDDDAQARHRQLGKGRPGYRLDGILLRGLSRLGTGMLTIRIDLDDR